ncbi:response regulator [Rhizobium halophytocola]|uniref:DNA-binding NtrC family response regulator n=1 Tax=Rhizobium halophytocola TaxID=735519 RepID=A0ABS4E5V4_9HYPH|nr:response regulator [Rhizobium halophytocola]MBP1853332.1 DNA-binding NtrC family response regulator [Rhizobium halophytocola]
MTDTSRNSSVLVVEDEPLILFDTIDMIEAAGFIVHSASNASDALGLMAACPDIGILFTDVDMPGRMNGLKLAETVRGRWPAVAIIIVSGLHRLNGHDIPTDSQFFSKPYGQKFVVGALEAADNRFV